MKFTIIFSLLLAALSVSAADNSDSSSTVDSGDRSCGIFVAQAGNVITGGYGNFLSATVKVAKQLLKAQFPGEYSVHILGSDAVKPSSISDKGNYLEFEFARYAKGIEYHGNTATIVAYITDGTQRVFDNNDYVYLVKQYNWQYTNPVCH